MTYFRVKPQYDQKKIYKTDSCGRHIFDGILIGNELLTACERSKINCTDAVFERVSISKKRTYFFFGARFSDAEAVTAC
mgnify:FL=1|jgi:hypothetical protein